MSENMPGLDPTEQQNYLPSTCKADKKIPISQKSLRLQRFPKVPENSAIPTYQARSIDPLLRSSGPKYGTAVLLTAMKG